MACDRFIYFKDPPRPSKDDVKIAIEDYFGAYLTGLKWDRQVWLVDLSGTKSWPFRRLASDSPFATMHRMAEKEPRYLEVVFGSDNIDVITRQQDEATNNLSDGLARLIARYWHGRLEMG